MDILSAIIWPLASSGSVTDGMLVCLFSGIKQKALDNVGIYKSIVLVIISLILIFKVVKHSYTIMSDEQHAGFGGIRLWDILRPLVIVLIIQSCSMFVSLFDSAVETVSMTIFKSVSEKTEESVKLTGNLIDTFEVEGKTYSLDSRKDARQIAKTSMGPVIDSLKTAKTQAWDTYSSGFANNSASASALDEYRRLKEQLSQTRKAKRAFKEALGEYVDCKEELTCPRSWSLASVMWVYDRIICCVIIVSDMILCCFILFLPLVLALSSLDFWKGAFKDWVGTYIEVSLWKVTAVTINWFVINARSAVYHLIMDGNLSAAKSMVDTMTAADYSSSGKAMLIFICVSLAGVIALFKVPSITNSILALGKPIGDLGLISSSILAPAKTLGGAARMGAKLTK